MTNKMIPATVAANKDLAAATFGSQLRRWRDLRSVSQLDLGLAAEVSQRHISWLETGRSQPSRSMIIQLSDALDIPVRERNNLLAAAGFAASYQQHPLNGRELCIARKALETMLEKQDPYPGWVIDREWNIVMANHCAKALFCSGGKNPDTLWNNVGDDGKRNLALLILHPNGLRKHLLNYNKVAWYFVHSLKQDAARAADPALKKRLQGFIELAEFDSLREPGYTESLLPVLPLELELNNQQLSMFCVISTFGTPQDATTDELRMESFFPSDELSATLLTELCASTGCQTPGLAHNQAKH